MKFLIKVLGQIYLLPYTLLKSLVSLFRKSKNPLKVPEVGQESSSRLKYYLSFAFWVLTGYFLFRSYIVSNRLVYARPLNYSQPCRNAEAVYKSYCDKSNNNCFRDYEKITLSNNRVVQFSYCDQKAIAVHYCYTETGDVWRIEYYGRNILK